MNELTAKTKFTVKCPKGHHVRGGTLVLGKTVRCPKCHSKFVFAPTNPADKKPVTESGVMRILGDMPQATAALPRASVPMRPCTRCGVSIPESLAVCSHCHCYVGVLPTFLQQLTPSSDTQRN